MEQLDLAITIQEALFDAPHEKLKSLQQKQKICIHMNAPEASIEELQGKIQECEKEMAQAKKCNYMRLEQMMEIVNCNAPDLD